MYLSLDTSHPHLSRCREAGTAAMLHAAHMSGKPHPPQSNLLLGTVGITMPWEKRWFNGDLMVVSWDVNVGTSIAGWYLLEHP